MLELIKILGVIWNYFDNTNLFIRIYKTGQYYFKFIIWFFYNPKVKMKYSRMLEVSGDYHHSLSKIKASLQSGNSQFSDGMIEQENRLIFEFKDTRLGYQIRAFPLKENIHHLKISTIFHNVFPFRELASVNEIKTDFYKLCEIVRKTGITIGNQNETIMLEVQIEPRKKSKKIIKSDFDYKDCKINFSGNKIQIDNTYGREFDQIILFILTKWLIDCY